MTAYLLIGLAGLIVGAVGAWMSRGWMDSAVAYEAQRERDRAHQETAKVQAALRKAQNELTDMGDRLRKLNALVLIGNKTRETLRAALLKHETARDRSARLGGGS